MVCMAHREFERDANLALELLHASDLDAGKTRDLLQQPADLAHLRVVRRNDANVLRGWQWATMISKPSKMILR